MGKVFAQIYSLKRQWQFAETLDAIKMFSEIGYDGIELLSTYTGGLSVGEFKKYIADLNLKVIALQSCRDEKDLEFARQLDLKYCPFGQVKIGKSRDEILAAAEKLNENGKIVAKYGMKLILHNHANEFMKVEGDDTGTRIYDLLIQNTDPALVAFQFDVGWAQLAGADCPAYIRKYPGRFPIIHVKECAKIAKSEEEYEHFPVKIIEYAKQLDPNFGKPGVPPKFPPEAEKMMYNSRSWNVALGEGLIDWKALRDAAEAQGVEAYANEREYYHITGNPEGDPFKAAQLDYKFMRSIFG